MEGENPIEQQVKPDLVDMNLDAVSDENQLDSLFDQAGTEMATLRHRLNNQSFAEQNPDDQKRLHDLQAFSDLILHRRDVLRQQASIANNPSLDSLPRMDITESKNSNLDQLSPEDILYLLEKARIEAPNKIKRLNEQKRAKLKQTESLQAEIAKIDADIATWEKIMNGDASPNVPKQEEAVVGSW